MTAKKGNSKAAGGFSAAGIGIVVRVKRGDFGLEHVSFDLGGWKTELRDIPVAIATAVGETNA